MNIKDFDALMKSHHPGQWPKEWQLFLEFCETYFRNRGIENPIVVELGVCTNNQEPYYERFLGARHIGIDISTEFSTPEIIGNTHDQTTLEKLKTALNGNSINLLFIDAAHDYKDVKMDYEMYGPLTENIIAFHDIMTEQVWVRKFWDELVKNNKEYTKMFFYKWSFRKYQYGIGLLIKE